MGLNCIRWYTAVVKHIVGRVGIVCVVIYVNMSAANFERERRPFYQPAGNKYKPDKIG